jgi:hypothetical protein
MLVKLDIKFVIDLLQNTMDGVASVKRIAHTIGLRLLNNSQSELSVASPAETFYIVEHVKVGYTNIQLSFENLETLREIY